MGERIKRVGEMTKNKYIINKLAIKKPQNGPSFTISQIDSTHMRVVGLLEDFEKLKDISPYLKDRIYSHVTRSKWGSLNITISNNIVYQLVSIGNHTSTRDEAIIEAQYPKCLYPNPLNKIWDVYFESFRDLRDYALKLSQK